MNFESEEDCIKAVSVNGGYLFQVRDQTERICLAAVRQNPWVLSAVKDKTVQICLASVQRSGLTLEFVGKALQTLEIVLASVQQNGIALGLVRKDLRTFNVCLAAVKQNGVAIQYVFDKKNNNNFDSAQIESLCIEAVTETSEALSLIPPEYQTVDVCLAAINGNTYTVLDKIEQPEPYICLKAVSRSSAELQFVSNPTNEMYVASVKQYLKENGFNGSTQQLLKEIANEYTEIEVVDEVNKQRKYIRSEHSVLNSIKLKYPDISVVTSDDNQFESLIVDEGLYVIKNNDKYEIYKNENKIVSQKGWFYNHEQKKTECYVVESWRQLYFE